MARMSLQVNGKSQASDVEPDMTLLYALRNDLKLAFGTISFPFKQRCGRQRRVGTQANA